MDRRGPDSSRKAQGKVIVVRTPSGPFRRVVLLEDAANGIARRLNSRSICLSDLAVVGLTVRE